MTALGLVEEGQVGHVDEVGVDGGDGTAVTAPRMPHAMRLPEYECTIIARPFTSAPLPPVVTLTVPLAEPV